MRRFLRASMWCLIAANVLAQSPPPARPASDPPPAQQPPAPEPPRADQPPTFRTGADLVRVDVSVLDRRGLPVSTLARDDFAIEEDGVPQAIQSFKFVSASGHPAEGDELSLPIRSRQHATAEAARDDVRVFLIFWDEYHINRLTSAVRAREVLMDFVRTAFGPTDLVAFMDPLTTLDSLRFTRDRLELAETVRTLRGRLGEYSPPRSLVEEAHLQGVQNIERLRSEVTVSALKAAAVHLGSLREGRKSIILISEGMRGLGRDEPMLIADLIQAANASNAGIFTINPLGLTMRRVRTFDMMEALASATGAEYSSSNDPTVALRRVVTQASGFYLLGYSSLARPMDGRFHRIKVRVRRGGVEVRARSGYWAPSSVEMERVRRAAAGARLPEHVEVALKELAPSNARRSVDLWIGTGQRTDGTSEVRLAWSPRDPAPEGVVTPSAVSIVATSGDERVFEGTIDAAGTAFPASPGPLQIVWSVLDASGGIVDRDTRTFTVPDVTGAPLSISSPVVLRSQSPLELRQLRSDPSPVPFAGREFARTDRLLIRFAVQGIDSLQATVSAKLLNRRAVRVADLAVGRLDGANHGYEVDLPLQTVARGEFLVSMEATHGGRKATALVPLRIVR